MTHGVRTWPQEGLAAWQVGFTGQPQYEGKIARSRTFWFSQLVWASDLQGALNAAMEVFFSSWPTGAALLPSSGYGSCQVVRPGSDAAKGYFRANPGEDPDLYDANTELCRLNVTKMKAMSGDEVGVGDTTPEPPTYVVQVPSTLY